MDDDFTYPHLDPEELGIVPGMTIEIEDKPF
jgi:hypothetical protein